MSSEFIDINGSIVKVGDKVVFGSVHYNNLIIGTVTKITPKFAYITNSYGRTQHSNIMKIVNNGGNTNV